MTRSSDNVMGRELGKLLRKLKNYLTTDVKLVAQLYKIEKRWPKLNMVLQFSKGQIWAADPNIYRFYTPYRYLKYMYWRDGR
ncbi:Hypothetical protein CINCED_3A022193 [Cinara cedri]|uniref:Uncharacterized protein n=1 Tax=Cinara cedri TaxID=506608 RepID=A0A5E4M8C5_9HEMI|nr:Hypothetical protein CINCED_3A022193 [Cinara cedri]